MIVTKEALDNAQSNEIIYLIHKLDDMRHQSSCHINRNKFANAFAQLLASEISYSDEFKKLMFSADDDVGVAEESKQEA